MEAVSEIQKVLNVRGKIIPATSQVITLLAEMEDGVVVKGEANIPTRANRISRVFYDQPVHAESEAIEAIRQADLIIYGIGSVYTSILPNVIIPEIQQELMKAKARKVYFCNVMTQPGETDGFTASDHINLLNSYLGKRKIDTVITNSKKVSKKTQKIYETLEQKDLVKIDSKNINIEHINKPLIKIENDKIRHDNMKLALEIMNILVK